MKIRTQLTLTLSLFGLILIGMAASLILTNQKVEQFRQQEEIARQIEQGADELNYLSGDYLMYGESQQRARWESSFAAFSESTARLKPANPEQQAIVDHIRADQVRLRAIFTDVVSILEESSDTSGAAPGPAFQQISWSRMEVQNQSIAFEASLLSQQLRDRADRLKQMNFALNFILIGLFGAYLLTNYYLIYQRTLKSIAELQARTEIIGSGSLDSTIPVKRADEIGELSHAFNRMTANLKEVMASKAELEQEVAERERVEEALREANEHLEQQALELEMQADELRTQTEELGIQAEALRERTGELSLANEQLRQSEQKFSILFEKASFSAALSRFPDGAFLEVNEAFERTFGYTRQEVIGRTSLELGINPDPEDRARILTVLQEHGSVGDIELKLRTKSGAARLFMLNIAFVEIGGQKYILQTAQDITARKQAEQQIGARTLELQAANQELRAARLAALNLMEDALTAKEQVKQINLRLLESEKRLNRAQEIAHLGSWELDLVDNRLTWSDEVYRLFGLQPQEFGASYEAFLEAVHPDDRAAVDAAYSGSIRDGRDSYDIEHRIVKRSSGEIRIVHEKCEHFRNEAGQLVRSVGMVHDITERKQAERRLAYLASFPERNPNPVIEVDFDGQVQYANPTALSILADLPERGPAHPWLAGLDKIVSAFREGQSNIVSRDVAVRESVYQQAFYLLAEERLIRIYGIDITERKRAEQALRAAHHELELRVQERTKELAATNTELVNEIAERMEIEEQLRTKTTAM